MKSQPDKSKERKNKTKSPSHALKKILVIESKNEETRVAILVGKKLESIHIERSHHESMNGNIYLGKVARVLPGIQSAFIELGVDRTGFIHAADFEGHLGDEADLGGFHAGDDQQKIILKRDRNDHFDLEHHLKKNQNILVQVIKDPIGTKGARLRSQLSLPGRFGVFLPNAAMVGVSKKIADRQVRDRLASDLGQIVTGGHGMIARTLAAEATLEELKADFEHLKKLGRNLKIRSLMQWPLPSSIRISIFWGV